MDVGGQLRRAREARAVSIDLLAQRTRVQPRILAAIEANDLPSIPPKPFGRGFVRAYAREVGLNPDQAVHDYFAQFAPPAMETAESGAAPEPTGGSGGWIWVVSGTAIVALIVAAMFGGTPRGIERADGSAIGTAGSTPPPELARGVAATSGPSAEAVAHRAVRQKAGLSVVLTAADDCWITATADGRRVMYRLLRAGGVETLRGDGEITIRAGDAGALGLTVNGREAGPLGGRGEVRTISITPDAFTIR